MGCEYFIRYAEGGRRTNRVSTCSHGVWLGSSCLWVYIKYPCVFWLCFGVATSIATCFLMVVLVVSLLHGLVYALLYERIVFKAHFQVVLMEECLATLRAFFTVFYA